jgi:acetyl esterase/lipase
MKMRDQKLGMPAAVVLWSPWSDITATGDTYVTLKHAEPTSSWSKVTPDRRRIRQPNAAMVADL